MIKEIHIKSSKNFFHRKNDIYSQLMNTITMLTTDSLRTYVLIYFYNENCNIRFSEHKG